MLSARSVRRVVATVGIAGLGTALPVIGAASANGATFGSAPHITPIVAQPSAPDADDATTTTTVPATAPAATPTAATTATGSLYTVVAGDTLSGIAAEHGTPGGWPALYRLNSGQLPRGADWIDIGQRLNLAADATDAATAAPAAPAKPAAAPAKPKPVEHTTRTESAAPSTTTTKVTTKAKTSSSSSATTLSTVDTSYATSSSSSASSSRGAQAVAFAEAQLGKPYVYGATGPSAYDCSGLAQAAWRAAGVSIPRVTTDQYASGNKVSISNLQPGDLVFYYSGVSHVGIYIGNGQIVQAPHPGAVVDIAPVDSMPIVGAVRPA